MQPASHISTAHESGPRVNARQRALMALWRGEGLPRVRGEPPRVAVVGAGLAGLSAARLLMQGGCRVAVFEASTRAGGRVRTERLPSGTVLECGGEFIDTQHADMLALVHHLRLPLLDLQAAGEAGLQSVFFFGGQRRTEHDFDAALATLAPQIAADVERIGARPTRARHTPADERFDRQSIAEYLQRLDCDAWVRQALEVAYVTVYGLDAGEQSALNLLTLVGVSASRGISVFGSSDERYKLRDGSAGVTDVLAAELNGRLYPGHRLVRLQPNGSSYRLALKRDAAATVEVVADAVVLALPFTLLRQVEMGTMFSPAKHRAIAELGYGTNSKLMLGMQSRPWRVGGFEGGIYTDLPLQSTWDSSRGRTPASPAIFTFYLGGGPGMAIGEGSTADQARHHAVLADRVFPSFTAAWGGLARRVHWPGEPLALGSYTCYRPGQWTTLGGDEARSEGRVQFAGEHCATGSQGYMDGAVGSGRRAALALLRRFS
ncbi:MAG: FAD-dependent oxidoreductase [Pseudomonadota bacterium]